MALQQVTDLETTKETRVRADDMKTTLLLFTFYGEHIFSLKRTPFSGGKAVHGELEEQKTVESHAHAQPRLQE